MEFTEQQKEVRHWLERRRGILLAHNYQPGEIQDVADFLGDSLALSMTAAKTPAEVIGTGPRRTSGWTCGAWWPA